MSQSAYSYLVKILSARDYSEHKLREKLREKQYSANEIDTAISEIKEKGFLREEAYSNARIRVLMDKGYSVNFIKLKLNQERVEVSEDQIHGIFLEYRETEDEQIKKLLTKKLKSVPEDSGNSEEAYSEKQKAARYALSKGHNPATVFKILKSTFNGSEFNETEFN